MNAQYHANPETIAKFTAAGLGVLRDVEVARKLGCSRERVRQVRVATGKSRVVVTVRGPDGHRHHTATLERDRQVIDECLRALRAGEVAACSSVSQHHAVKRLGLPSMIHLPKYGRRGSKQYDLMEVIDTATSCRTKAELAEKLGMSAPNLHSFLFRYGIVQAVEQLIEHTPGERGGPPRKWKSESLLKAVKQEGTIQQAAISLGMTPTNFSMALQRRGIRDIADLLVIDAYEQSMAKVLVPLAPSREDSPEKL